MTTLIPKFDLKKGGATPTGAVNRPINEKLAEIISVKDFGAIGDGTTDDTVAIQNAINSGAYKITIGCNCLVSSSLALIANQVIDFAGGSLITNASFSATSGVLTGSSVSNVTIIEPIINASTTTGATGIKLTDCANSVIKDARLTKCNIELYASANTIPMNYVVRGAVINGNGWQNTLFYTSKVYKAAISDVICYNGLEGFGVYNACLNLKYTRCESYGHTRDGFVIIQGQRIAYSECFAYSNTQSGFTTQRLTAGTDVQRISYAGCHAYDNTADGFDIRGANTTPYGVNMLVTCDGCISTNNGATGFYIVMAEGTSLSGCVTAQNQYPGISVNQSNYVLLNGCKSASNANAVSSGTAKAGILFQSCANSGAVGCDSQNSIGVTQDYGISFTGTTTDNWITGGNYLNNSILPAQLGDTGTQVYVAGSAIQDVANVYPDTVTAHTGIFSETGFGVPTHTRPKSSMFRRVNAGGSGEVYVSNGGGSWYLLS